MRIKSSDRAGWLLTLPLLNLWSRGRLNAGLDGHDGCKGEQKQRSEHLHVELCGMVEQLDGRVGDQVLGGETIASCATLMPDIYIRACQTAYTLDQGRVARAQRMRVRALPYRQQQLAGLV